MPIKPENAHRYPANWPEIRARILRRAGNRCEQCGIKNYALGGRTSAGDWLPAFPLGEKLLRTQWPREGQEWWCGDHHGNMEFLRIIRIVLTIAHLDHVPEHCADENLKALCQHCHLCYDAKHHAQTAYATRRKGRACADMFDDTQ